MEEKTANMRTTAEKVMSLEEQPVLVTLKAIKRILGERWRVLLF